MEVPPNLSTIVNYRIHELAKDFGVPSKAIMDILAKYGVIPKNHMQILTDEELNYLFDYLTQENQTSDINAVLMAQLKRQEETPVPKKEASSAKKQPQPEKPVVAEVQQPVETQPAPIAQPEKACLRQKSKLRRSPLPAQQNSSRGKTEAVKIALKTPHPCSPASRSAIRKNSSRAVTGLHRP